MERMLVVALGGLLGCLCRYGVATWLSVPYATLLVNLVGCALLAALMQATRLDPLLRLGLCTGFMGGFTTYSTYNYELLKFLEGEEWGKAALYAGITGAGGLLSGALGFWIGRKLGA